MNTYEVSVNGRQYAMLEKMLRPSGAGQMADNQPINGYMLFSDILHYICSPVTDGWSTYEFLFEESKQEIELLRTITRQVFTEDKNFFVKQIGKKFKCEKNFEVRINLDLRR